MDEIKYPISEIFTSVQGEGYWVGRRMTFVRLAGCTVGKPYPKERYNSPALMTNLPIYTEKCSLWKGEMACDTDYRVKERLTVEEILYRIGGEEIVCITGGEPLMHNLETLVEALITNKNRIHLETSGTKDLYELCKLLRINRWVQNSWIAVSPKRNYLPSSLNFADEIKVIIDREQFDQAEFERNFWEYLQYDHKVYLQPVNGEHEVNQDNLAFCLELLAKYPTARLSAQLHKFIHVR